MQEPAAGAPVGLDTEQQKRSAFLLVQAEAVRHGSHAALAAAAQAARLGTCENAWWLSGQPARGHATQAAADSSASLDTDGTPWLHAGPAEQHRARRRGGGQPPGALRASC